MCSAWNAKQVLKYVLLASTPLIFWLSSILVLSTPTPYLVIASGSMTPNYLAGDLVVVRGVQWSNIRVDDVIVFRSPRPGDARIYIHRAVGVLAKEDGEYVKTRGDDSPYADSWLIPGENVLGRVIAKFPGLGRIRVAAGRHFLHVILLLVIVNGAVFLISAMVQSRRGYPS